MYDSRSGITPSSRARVWMLTASKKSSSVSLNLACGPGPQSGMQRDQKLRSSTSIPARNVSGSNTYSLASFPGLSSSCGCAFPGVEVGKYWPGTHRAFITQSARTSVSRVIIPSLMLSLEKMNERIRRTNN